MKQVIMVLGNGKFDILRQTISILDDPDIDFYIYVNKHNKFPSLSAKFSNINFVRGSKARWGHFSEIQAELMLIRQAVKNDYDYYHFIDANDFPLMDREHFKKYFSSKPIKLGFTNYSEGYEFYKIQHYYPLKFIDLKKKIFPGIYVKIVNLIGNLFNVKRIEDESNIEKGFPFFSLPKKYVKKIYCYKNASLFNNTLDGKEFFNQMLLPELKPKYTSLKNSKYSRRYRMMKSALEASRLVNYLKLDNFNWFYFPEYEYSKKDFELLREKTNKNLAFVHTIKSGERPSLIFKKGENNS